MRLLGIDHGQARVGLAVSDPSGTVATPYGTHTRLKKRKQDIAALTVLARSLGCEGFVIGIPLDRDGTRGKKAREVDQFADALREHSGLPVHEMDERFTTVRAEQALTTMSVKGARRRDLVDRVAAAIILQDFLDSRVKEPRDET